MFFWKIDEETIRCLINKEEIIQMGFDFKALGNDSNLMEEFLNAIINDSKNYINWNSENGIQNYVARALPSDQFLITISCTFQDVAIDRDLDQIKKMTTALREKISDERIDSIYSMSGEEKEKEFEALAKDLHNVCMGNAHNQAEKNAVSTGQTENENQQSEIQERLQIPSQKLIFKDFHNLLSFCALLNKKFFIPSTLYKAEGEYVLLVDFPQEMENAQIISFMITAEEYGAECSNLNFEGYYLSEHAKMIIKDSGIETLHRMS